MYARFSSMKLTVPYWISAVEPRESELIGADLCSDSGEFGLSGKFGKILLIYQMQLSTDSGYSVKAYGKRTRRFERYGGKQVEGKKKIPEFVSTNLGVNDILNDQFECFF
ncbi:hypothetical protein AVEN_211087-1 [Araneus ventricosus]|uniref:Uncharacterized protein n=1 Tax=Araneus ventricosus TaxID=182803 RepID=A0A4Y2GV05_ARAVE|nr:hypothetical protein AVEN_211087-1 [Araneus ventricosus]